MIQFYVNRIRAGKMTIEQVPEKWRSSVQQALNEYPKN